MAEPMERELTERERDRAFEANQHMSTLSASALGLLFVAAQFHEGGIESVGWGVAVFGLSLVVSLLGMRDALVSEWVSGDNRRVAFFSSEGYFLISLSLFVSGVLLIVVYPAVTGGFG